MRQLFLNENIKYLIKTGVSIGDEIVLAAKNSALPELDNLIEFSNNTGISINDFLFVDIEQKESLS